MWHRCGRVFELKLILPMGYLMLCWERACETSLPTLSYMTPHPWKGAGDSRGLGFPKGCCLLPLILTEEEKRFRDSSLLCSRELYFRSHVRQACYHWATLTSQLLKMILKQGPPRLPSLVLNSLCGLGWLWTYDLALTSPSWEAKPRSFCNKFRYKRTLEFSGS